MGRRKSKLCTVSLAQRVINLDRFDILLRVLLTLEIQQPDKKNQLKKLKKEAVQYNNLPVWGDRCAKIDFHLSYLQIDD